MNELIFNFLKETFHNCKDDFLNEIAANLTKILQDGSDEITRQMAEEMRTISDKNLELMENEGRLIKSRDDFKRVVEDQANQLDEKADIVKTLHKRMAELQTALNKPIPNKELRQVETVILDGLEYYRVVPDRDVV